MIEEYAELGMENAPMNRVEHLCSRLAAVCEQLEYHVTRNGNVRTDGVEAGGPDADDVFEVV
jgi:hypothetical protein